jgi:hypothetical protein
MVAPAGLRGHIDSAPKGWTWIEQGFSQNMNLPRELYQKIMLPYSVEMEEKRAAIIKEYFHVPFFLMLYQAAFNKVDLTATQVIGMQGEQAAVLGARIGRYEHEGLQPIIDRICILEEDKMPKPPQILLDFGGTHIEIDYLGQLAQAQKRLFKVQGIKAGLEGLAAFREMAPESLDIPNFDEGIKEYLEASGWPAKAIKTDEDVMAIRKMRMQKQQMEETLRNTAGIAKVLPGAGKAIEPNSLMDMLTGTKE